VSLSFDITSRILACKFFSGPYFENEVKSVEQRLFTRRFLNDKISASKSLFLIFERFFSRDISPVFLSQENTFGWEIS